MTYQKLENMYRKNPLREYFCIKNPEMISGEVKNICFDVEIYQIEKFKNKNIYFKRVGENEKFPKELVMPYYIDSESEIIKDDDTYSIFSTREKAEIQKAERLNRFLNSLKTFYDNYESYKEEDFIIENEEELDDDAKKMIEEMKKATKLPEKDKIKNMIEKLEALNLEEKLNSDEFLLNFL